MSTFEIFWILGIIIAAIVNLIACKCTYGYLDYGDYIVSGVCSMFSWIAVAFSLLHIMILYFTNSIESNKIYVETEEDYYERVN